MSGWCLAFTDIVRARRRNTMRTILTLMASLASAAAHIASEWPAQPLFKSETAHMAHRALAAEEDIDIGMYQIILWSSITIVIAAYFATIALVNMDVGNDSLLYSKAKME
eukprot:6199405-Pleurochrysis_carterae.AAC.1